MRKTIIIHIFFAIISAIVYVEGILTKGPDLIWNMFIPCGIEKAYIFLWHLFQVFSLEFYVELRAGT